MKYCIYLKIFYYTKLINNILITRKLHKNKYVKTLKNILILLYWVKCIFPANNATRRMTKRNSPILN